SILATDLQKQHLDAFKDPFRGVRGASVLAPWCFRSGTETSRRYDGDTTKGPQRLHGGTTETPRRDHRGTTKTSRGHQGDITEGLWKHHGGTTEGPRRPRRRPQYAQQSWLNAFEVQEQPLDWPRCRSVLAVLGSTRLHNMK